MFPKFLISAPVNTQMYGAPLCWEHQSESILHLYMCGHSVKKYLLETSKRGCTLYSSMINALRAALVLRFCFCLRLHLHLHKDLQNTCTEFGTGPTEKLRNVSFLFCCTSKIIRVETQDLWAH